MKLTKKHIYSNNEFFGRWARIYDLEKYIFFPLRKESVEFANLQSYKKILDVATGTGALALEFAKFGHNVVGIDVSPKMLDQAKKSLIRNYSLVFRKRTELHYRSKIIRSIFQQFLGAYTICHLK